MLQKMNEYIKGWVAGVIVVVIGVSFVFWGVASYVTSASGDKAAVAKVNGDAITMGEFSQQYREMKKTYLKNTGASSLPDDMAAQVKQYLLEQLISQKVLLQSAKKMHFSVTPQQVDAFLQQDPAFQDKGKFSPQRLQMAIYASGASSPQAFLSSLQDQFLLRQVQNGMENSSFVLPNEWQAAYGLTYETRDVGYVAIPVDDFMSSVKVTDKAIKTYYDAHQSAYKVPQEVSFYYLALDPSSYSSSISVSDEEAKQYYDDHQANYTTPKQWVVSVVSIPLTASSSDANKKKAMDNLTALSVDLRKTNADVSALAKQYGATLSEQTLTSSNKIVPVELLEKLKAGQSSNPYQTDQGVMIVRLDSVKEASSQSFSEVAASIRSALKSQQLDALMEKDTKLLSDLTYTNPDSLSAAAKALKLTVQTTDLMTSSGEKTGLFSDPLVLKAAFSDEVLKQGYNSDPVTLKNNMVVVVRKGQLVPSKVSSLASVSADIKKTLAADQAQQLAGVAAYKAQQALQSAQNPQDVASKLSLAWKIQKAMTRQSKVLPPSVVEAVFSARLGDKKTIYNNILVDNKTYYVIGVEGSILADYKKASADALASFQSQLTRAYAQSEYLAYALMARDQATIKINQKVLDKIN